MGRERKQGEWNKGKEKRVEDYGKGGREGKVVMQRREEGGREGTVKVHEKGKKRKKKLLPLRKTQEN